MYHVYNSVQENEHCCQAQPKLQAEGCSSVARLLVMSQDSPSSSTIQDLARHPMMFQASNDYNMYSTMTSLALTSPHLSLAQLLPSSYMFYYLSVLFILLIYVHLRLYQIECGSFLGWFIFKLFRMIQNNCHSLTTTLN